MDVQTFSRMTAAACLLSGILSLSACGSSSGGSSRNYDSGDSASVAVGGNDGWWVGAPVNSSPKSSTPEKAKSDEAAAE